MAKGYVNWKLAIVLVVATCVCVGAGLILHDWQKSTRADQALPLGRAAYEKGDWAEAATQLGNYLAVKGDDVEILLKYGHAQRQIRPLMRGNVDQAISAYSTVLRSDQAATEQTYEATRWLVEIYLGLRRPEEAEPVARGYLVDHDDPLLRQLLGLALGRQRKFEEAYETLTRLVKDHPDEVRAYDLLGNFAMSRPDDFNEPAEYWYDQAVGQNPESALAHIIRGGYRLTQNDLSSARIEFETAEGLDLSDTQVHLELVERYVDIRELDRARAHLEMVKVQAPTELELWRLWTKVATISQSVDEMREVAETGLKELGDHAWGFMPWAAELFIRIDQLDKARDCVAQMKEKDLQPARISFLEGCVAEREGRLDDAASAWQKAIGLGYQSSGDHLWRNELPRVRIALAAVLSKQGNVPEAISQLRSQISETPNAIDARLGLARLLAKAGDWSGVLEQTRQVKRVAPKQADATFQELNARVQLLVVSEEPEGAKAQAWQEIDSQLSELEEEPDYRVQAKLLRAQAAAAQEDYDRAGAILDSLEGGHEGELLAALLRVGMRVNEGKTDEAIAQLKSIVERFPQSADPVQRLARLLDGRGDRSGCESVIKAAMDRIESPPLKKGLALRLARLYDSWGQGEQYRQWLMDLAARFPDDITIKRLVIESGAIDIEHVQKIIDEIKAIEGQSGRQWRLEQARLWMAPPRFKAKYSDVIRLLQENLLSNPEDQASRVLLAKAYEMGGEQELALMIWREAMARSPESADVLVGAVSALYAAGEDDEAQDVLDRAKRQEIHDSRLQVLWAEGQRRAGALDAAAETLRAVVAQDPNHRGANLNLARLYAAQKDYDKAHELIDALRAKDPNDLDFLGWKLRICEAQNNAQEAIEICNAAVTRLGNASAHLLRAQTLEKLQQFGGALADLNQAVALAPDNAGVWLARAELLRTLGRIPEAVSDAQKALALAPNRLDAQKMAAKAFLDSGDAQLAEKSEELIEQGIKFAPKDAELKYLKARSLLRQQTRATVEQARVLLEQVVQEDDAFPEAWELLASLELRWYADPGRAVDLLREATKDFPNNRRLLAQKAQAERQLDPNLAAATLTIVIDRDPNDLNVVVALADLYMKDPGREADALKLLDRSVSVFVGPARRTCQVKRAEALFRSGAVDEAVASFESLIDSDPNEPSPVLAWGSVLLDGHQWDQVGTLVQRWRSTHPEDQRVPILVAGALSSSGRPDAVRKAEEILRAVLKSHPDSLGALEVLATVMLKLERSDELIAVGRRILDIDPNNVGAMNNLAWVLCEDGQRYQQALDLANKGVELSSQFADIIDTRGVIHHRMGNYEEAVQDFLRCTELYSPAARALPLTRLHLAKSLIELGRKTEATQQLQQAMAAQSKAREQGIALPLTPEQETELRALLEKR